MLPVGRAEPAVHVAAAAALRRRGAATTLARLAASHAHLLAALATVTVLSHRSSSQRLRGRSGPYFRDALTAWFCSSSRISGSASRRYGFQRCRESNILSG